MRGEWCYFHKHFSDQTCDDIIKMGLKIPPEPGKIGLDGVLVESNIRKSQVRFINKPHNDFNFLFDEIWKLASQGNDEWFNFHLSRLNFLQFTEYNGGSNDEYQRHHDVFWLNNDPMYHRKLTCVIQLTDPSTYDGGNFEIYDLQDSPVPDAIRQRGTVLFIPSFTYHAVTPVTQGTRHSIVAWIEGPKWR